MAKETDVAITGLKELKAALKDMDARLPKEIAKGLKAITANVADKVRAKMPRGKTGKAQSSVKASGTQKGGSIKYGASNGVVGPWNTSKNLAGWLDFGGRVGKGHSVKRPVVKGGRYLYPTISAEHQNTIDAVDKLINELGKSVGFETRGHL